MAYVRPLVEVKSFSKGRGASRMFYELCVDLHNRRVTVSWWRLGRKVRVKVHSFSTRDDARDFVDTILERREDLGYTEVLRAA